MDYTIQQIATMAGISTRTLRYYDSIGLLAPACITESGYRIYKQPQIDRLQQILFYKHLGLELSSITKILDAPDFDAAAALETHLLLLQKQRDTLDQLILNAQKTLQSLKGTTNMNNQEKFEGFKKQLVDENMEQYADELLQNYGEETVNAANAKMLNMSQQEFEAFEMLGTELNQALIEAVATGDPASPAAQKAAQLHKQWLCCTWPSYSAEAHCSLAQGYVDDPRFTAYYEKIVPGGAVFLRDAILLYCGSNQ